MKLSAKGRPSARAVRTPRDSGDAAPDSRGRRSRKLRATRQAISRAATRLFFERGFENVTVDEIAAAADVGRMTVFNHFPRKEDMFFDRDEEARADLRKALDGREPRVAPIETLRRFMHRLVAEDAPYVRFVPESQTFVETIRRSKTLQDRARALRDEIAEVVAVALAESVGRKAPDLEARLTAELLLAAWSVAFIQAHDAYRKRRSSKAAAALFLAIADRGARAANAAMAGTAYVRGQ